jgi:two-component system LytT family sensor kinase
VQIPSLIVQPLVENAIKHGIAAARSGGLVAVHVRMGSTDGHAELIIEVRNTGAPLTPRGTSPSGGVGLENVQQRLLHYYNGHASLRLISDPSGATVAELRLPASGRGEPRLTATTGRATW